jgi:hypothetical protein
LVWCPIVFFLRALWRQEYPLRASITDTLTIEAFTTILFRPLWGGRGEATMRIETLALLSLLVFAPSATAAECTQDKLLGTWKQTRAKMGAQENNPTPTSQEIKHVTQTHFTWVHYDPTTGKADASGGGTYSLVGGSYTEKIEFVFGPEDINALLRKQFQFACSIDGDTWTIKGNVLDTPLDETWERMAAQK